MVHQNKKNPNLIFITNELGEGVGAQLIFGDLFLQQRDDLHLGQVLGTAKIWK